MSPKVLVYTFFKYHSVTYKILQTLNNIDKKIISNRTNIDKFAQDSLERKYIAIIGLGDYMKTAKKLRIETCFINRYGKHSLKENSPQYINATINIPKDLALDCTLSTKPTWGPCNRSAYILANKAISLQARTKVGFIHIPKYFDINRASVIVKEIIQENIYYNL